MIKLFLLLNPVYVTFFWAVALNLHSPGRNLPRNFLGKQMTVAFILYISHLCYYLPLSGAYHYLDSVYELCSLLVIPMYYIYIRLLTIDSAFTLRRHARYLITPVLLFVLYLAGVWMMSREQHLDFLFRIMPNNEPVEGTLLYLKMVRKCCDAVFVLQAFLYMTMSLRLIIINKHRVLQFYSNTEEDSIDHILILSITMCVAISTGIIISLLGKEFFLTDSQYTLILPSIIFSLMYFGIGWLGYKQRPLLTDMVDKTEIAGGNEQDEIPADNNTSEEDAFLKKLEPIRLCMEKLFEEKELFRNPNLTIWDVANAANTNRTYISYLMNNYYCKNFSTFVNAYRVRYAKRLTKAQPHLNKYDVATASGFNSRESMKRALSAWDDKNK